MALLHTIYHKTLFLVKFLRLTCIRRITIGVIFPSVQDISFFTKGLLQSLSSGFLCSLWGSLIFIYINDNDFRIRIWIAGCTFERSEYDFDTKNSSFDFFIKSWCQTFSFHTRCYKPPRFRSGLSFISLNYET